VVFARSATSKRLKVYCSPECMAEARSVEYAARPDILANLRRHREAA
jgi:hypothetical protein